MGAREGRWVLQGAAVLPSLGVRSGWPAGGERWLERARAQARTKSRMIAVLACCSREEGKITYKRGNSQDEEGSFGSHLPLLGHPTVRTRSSRAFAGLPLAPTSPPRRSLAVPIGKLRGRSCEHQVWPGRSSPSVFRSGLHSPS